MGSMWFSVATLFLLFVVCSSSRDPTIEFGQNKVADTYCVAKPGLADYVMARSIAYYCQQPGVNCGPVTPGGACYTGKAIDHLAYILDSYYFRHAKQAQFCPSDVGYLTTINLSFGSCTFP